MNPQELLGKTVNIRDGIKIKANFMWERETKRIDHADGSLSANITEILFGETNFGRYQLTNSDKVLGMES